MAHNVYIYIFIMFLVSITIRLLPMTIFRKPIRNRFVRSFLSRAPGAYCRSSHCLGGRKPLCRRRHLLRRRLHRGAISPVNRIAYISLAAQQRSDAGLIQYEMSSRKK